MNSLKKLWYYIIGRPYIVQIFGGKYQVRHREGMFLCYVSKIDGYHWLHSFLDTQIDTLNEAISVRNSTSIMGNLIE